MTALIAVAGSGPVQGNFLTLAKHAWPKAIVIDVESMRILHPSNSHPLWTWSIKSKNPTTLGYRYLRQLYRDHQVQHVIAVGLAAVKPVASLAPGMEIDLVVLRGELDFSSRRKQKIAQFREAVRLSRRLWLEDEYEMDKAVAQGSDKPHFRTPITSLPTALWDTERPTPKLAVIYPHSWSGSQLSDFSQGLAEWGADEVETVKITAESLYSRVDMASSRGFPGTIRYRVGSAPTHVVILGNSPGHQAIIAAYSQWGESQLYIDGTINNRALARRLSIPARNIARGAALGQRLASSLHHWPEKSAPFAVSSEFIHPESIPGIFARARSKVVPWWFEENITDPSRRHLDFFFTTAPLEDRSDGARPQRIRAMSEVSQRSDAATLRLSSSNAILRRRGFALSELLDMGVQPGYGYGENSTAPMPAESLNLFLNVLRQATSRGLKFGWFVRDLHWLSSETPTFDSLSSEALSQMRRQGFRELDEISKYASKLFAPSDKGADEFQRLLEETGNCQRYSWESLPPGVFRELSLDPLQQSDGHSGILHLSYTGGFGGIYDIDLVFKALESIDVEWTLELMVRPDDVLAVHEATKNLPQDRVTILSGEFQAWQPKPGRNLGLVLLSSRYGKATFPFKTVSYLEKRVPVLAYKGSSAAEFVETQGVGFSCEPTLEGVRDALTQAASSEAIADEVWERALRKNTWEERFQTVLFQLGGKNRPVSS